MGESSEWDLGAEVDEDARGPLARNPVARDKYSLDAFYTTSVNNHDHSDPMSVKVPATLNAIMGALIQSGRLPDYKTRQDLVRDAVTHRLQYLSTVVEVDGIEEWVRQEHALKQAENKRQRRVGRDKIVENNREEVRIACAGQERGIIMDLIVDLQGVMEWLVEEPWRGQMEGLMKELEGALTRMG